MKDIQLIHGDCLVEMQNIPDKSVDCILCDLPYGTTQCKWDVIIPFEPLWKEYKRVCSGAIVLFATEPFTSKLIMSNCSNFKEKLTWVKHKPSNIGNAKIRHLKYSEDIVVFSFGKYTFNPQYIERESDRVRQAQRGNSKQWRTNKKPTQEVSFATQYEPRDWHTFDADRKLQGNVLNYPAVVSNSKEKVNHPTQKPVRLLEYLIKTYSDEGELILDNTAGSMTTAIAAINTNRRCICIEKDDHYFEIGSERVRKHLENRQLSLFNKQTELF